MEGRFVPIFWRFGKLNFTYLGSLWHRSRQGLPSPCLLRHRLLQCRRRGLAIAEVDGGNPNLVYFGTLIYFCLSTSSVVKGVGVPK